MPALDLAAEIAAILGHSIEQLLDNWSFDRLGLSSEEVSAWESEGWDRLTALPWLAAGAAPEEAREWRRARIRPPEACEWISEGFGPSTAADWRAAGVEPIAAGVLTSGRITPEQIGDRAGVPLRRATAKSVPTRVLSHDPSGPPDSALGAPDNEDFDGGDWDDELWDDELWDEDLPTPEPSGETHHARLSVEEARAAALRWGRSSGNCPNCFLQLLPDGHCPYCDEEPRP